jgi:hypothetical protein
VEQHAEPEAVSDKRKPRRFQFSLKTLFVLTTVACVVAAIASLVTRSHHFHQEAVFHRSQFQDSYFPNELGVYAKNFHRAAALAYEEATYQPWQSPSFSRIPPKPPPEIPPNWVEMESIYDEMRNGPVETSSQVPNRSERP